MLVGNNLSLFGMILYLAGCSGEQTADDPSANEVVTEDFQPPAPRPPSDNVADKNKQLDLQKEALKIQKDLECLRGRPFLSDPSVAFQSMSDFKKFIEII